MESPLNLLNRLKLATKRTDIIPTIPPKSGEIIPALDEKLSLGGLKTKAATVMMSALRQLEEALPNIERPEKLADIAADMSKVLNASNNHGNVNNVQVVVYQPRTREEQDYEAIVVNE